MMRKKEQWPLENAGLLMLTSSVNELAKSDRPIPHPLSVSP